MTRGPGRCNGMELLLKQTKVRVERIDLEFFSDRPSSHSRHGCVNVWILASTFRADGMELLFELIRGDRRLHS